MDFRAAFPPLVLVLAALLLAPTTRAQVTLSLPPVSGTIGETIVFPVAVTDLTGQGVRGYQFTLAYDPAVLSLDAIHDVGTLSEGLLVFFNNPEAGTFAGAVAGTDEMAGQGTLLLITGTLLGGGTSPLTWVDFLFDVQGLGLTLEDGMVTVTTPANVPPVISSTPPLVARVGVPYRYELTSADVEGDARHYTALTLPGWLTLTDHNDDTALLDGTPTLADVGDHEVVIEIADALGATSQRFTLIVAENFAPLALPDAGTTDEDTPLDLDLLANDTDPDGDGFTLSALGNPSHGTTTLNADGTVRYAPAAHYFGHDAFTYTLTDDFGGMAEGLVTLTVVPVNDPPIFPTPLFQTPAPGTALVVGGETRAGALDADTPFVIEWNAATDVDGPPAVYTWELSATEDFSTCCLLAGNTGTALRFETDFGTLASALDDLGVLLQGEVTLYHRLTATDGTALAVSPAAALTLVRGTLVGAEPEAGLPTTFALRGNYPNPFNPATHLVLDLPAAAEVSVAVFDLRGRQVQTLPPRPLAAGGHRVLALHAGGLPSGTYLYRVLARFADRTATAAGTFTLLK